MSEKLNVTYGRVTRICRNLAEQILVLQPGLKTIVAVTRGGLFPAAVLSRFLDIKDVRVIGLSSYDEEKQGKIDVFNRPDKIDVKTSLFVDDLIDSGKTYYKLEELYGKDILFTCCYKKSFSPKEIKPLGNNKIVRTGKWVVFPWEHPSIR